jgi:hypothetical protein
MIKNLIALAAVASVAGLAVPAYADSESRLFGTDSSPEAQRFVENSILSRLKAQGVNATSVEEWGNYVLAFVTLEDGRQSTQLFTHTLLEPVSL